MRSASKLRRGEFRLSKVHNARRKPLNDAAIERLIAEIGPNRVWSALDRFTSPQRQFAF
jgi:hypothetical protein